MARVEENTAGFSGEIGHIGVRPEKEVDIQGRVLSPRALTHQCDLVIICTYSLTELQLQPYRAGSPEFKTPFHKGPLCQWDSLLKSRTSERVADPPKPCITNPSKISIT